MAILGSIVSVEPDRFGGNRMNFRGQIYFEYLKVQAVFVRRIFFQMTRAIRTIAPYALNSKTGILKKEVTEQYPDRMSSRLEHELPTRFRGTLENDATVCTGCGDCVSVCPLSCIRLKTEASPDPVRLWVTEYQVDFSQCVYCGLCVESCEPGSLRHSRKFELLGRSREELVIDFGRGKISEEQRDFWNRERARREQEESPL